ncbi:hypothetical protein Tco_0133912 [Tanacetum coccineum]
MAANGASNDGPPPAGGNGLPVPDLRTIEELYQPTFNGRGGPITPINIQATNFRLKNDMINRVKIFVQFQRTHILYVELENLNVPGDDANKHLDKYLHVPQSIKVN